MRRRVRTFAGGIVLALATTTAGLLAGAPAATAAEPVVIGSCNTTVRGEAGTPISLRTSAVTGPIMDIIGPLDLLGIGDLLGSLPPIPIGAIATDGGVISGATIANAVVGKLPLGSLLLNRVTATLTDLCQVTTRVVVKVVEPVQEGAAAVGEVVEEGTKALPLPGRTPDSPGAPQRPGTNPGTTPDARNDPPGGGGAPTGPKTSVIGGLTPGGVPLYDSTLNHGRSPMADYSSIPVAAPGLFAPSPAVRYGGSVPGYSPQFGILGTEDDGDGVQVAGHAEALGLPAEGSRIALPVLLAVLALSGVTAALVRTWVLRRTA